MSPTAGPSRELIAGGVAGLAWSAAMRGWMAQLAAGMPPSHSQVTWLTLVLVLMPGIAVGVLLGRAVYLRQAGLPASPRLVFAPVVFASALLDPHILMQLLRNGTGAGSLVVVATALSIGYVITRARWSLRRGLASVVAVAGLLIVLGMGGLAAPLDTPHGAWVGALGFALVLLLGLASALPHPAVRECSGIAGFVTLGGLIGFTWAAGLYGLMAQVDAVHGATWVGTFITTLLPGTLVGALLGWAAYGRKRDGPYGRRSTLPFIAALLGVITIGSMTTPAGSVSSSSFGTIRGIWLTVYFASFIAVSAFGFSTTRRGFTRNG